jgi:hypothetical protein
VLVISFPYAAILTQEVLGAGVISPHEVPGDGFIEVYPFPGFGTILPHTRTVPTKPVAEIPVTKAVLEIEAVT